MLKATCFAIVCLLLISVSKGQIVIKGKIENLPLTVNQIAIDKWSGDSWTELERMEVAGNGAFYQQVHGKYGQMRLRLWGEPSHWIDFIMPQNPAIDSLLDFGTIDYSYIDGNPAKLKGKENEAYFNLLTDHNTYRVLRDSLSRSKNLSEEAKALLETEVEKAKALSNKRCKEVTIANPGTFSGDIVSNLLYVPEPADYEMNANAQKLSKLDFERKHLLDRLPLADGRVLQHNGLIRALNQYTMKFLDADSSDYINRVLGKRKGNEEVDTWLFKYLYQVSLNYKNDNAISFLVKWFYTDNPNGAFTVDRSTKTTIDAFRNCEVGKKAFDLSLPEAGGKNIRLVDIAAKSKLTLLLFWRTDCSHCREFEPELEKLYKRYKPLGLEVIGISMDSEETKWREHLATNAISWTSLYAQTRDHRLQVLNNFPIPGTPSLIAVDNNFKVKNRMVIRATIEKYLEDELGK